MSPKSKKAVKLCTLLLFAFATIGCEFLKDLLGLTEETPVEFSLTLSVDGEGTIAVDSDKAVYISDEEIQLTACAGRSLRNTGTKR